MQPIYVISAARTPLGRFGGAFADVSPVDLGGGLDAGCFTTGRAFFRSRRLSTFLATYCDLAMGSLFAPPGGLQGRNS